MPGVPSGRGCDGCRKQKKKCDQLKPTCTRCARLGLLCVGSGQQRYKFMQQQQQQQLSRRHETKTKDLSTSRVTFHISGSPCNQLTALRKAYVATIQLSTDLRFNLFWAFGCYMNDIPKRLGTNDALDAASAALVKAHADYCTGRSMTVSTLQHYERALERLRICLADPIQAHSSEALCAVMLLLQCQYFLGSPYGGSSAHIEGMAQVLHARGSFQSRNDFETKLLLSLRGAVIFEGLTNSKVRLSVKQWKQLASNPLDGNTHEGKMMRSLCLIPPFMVQRADPARDLSEEAEILSEIQSGYATLVQSVKILKTDVAKLASQPITDQIIMKDAYTSRVYGLCITIALLLNCVLMAVDPQNLQLSLDAAEFAMEGLIVCKLAAKYRPLGAHWIPLCLPMTWIGTNDPVLKLSIEEALKDYYKGYIWGNAQEVTRNDFQSFERRFRHLDMGNFKWPD